jgi:hypothetical protein
MLNEKPYNENVWDRRGIAPLILNLGTDGGEWSFSFLGHFTPGGGGDLQLATEWENSGPHSWMRGEESLSHHHESNHNMLVALPTVWSQN